jgi:hypothetical protein
MMWELVSPRQSGAEGEVWEEAERGKRVRRKARRARVKNPQGVWGCGDEVVIDMGRRDDVSEGVGLEGGSGFRGREWV